MLSMRVPAPPELWFSTPKSFNTNPASLPSSYGLTRTSLASPDLPDLFAPAIDLNIFLSGDPAIVANTIRSVDEACKKHGFFLIVNHGIDPELIAKAHQYIDLFFGMKLSEKQRAQRKVGESEGYTSSFTGSSTPSFPGKKRLLSDLLLRASARRSSRTTL